MKIYISGAITGVEGAGNRFEQAEEALREEGHITLNPYRVNAELPADTTHEEYMLTSLAMLKMADAIFILRDWEQSVGVKIELEEAIKQKKIIFFEGGK